MDKIDLANVDFTPELLRSLPAGVAQLYHVLPVRQSDRGVLLAMAPMPLLQAKGDELDSVRTELRFIVARDVEFVIADRDQIATFIQKLYGTYQ